MAFFGQVDPVEVPPHNFHSPEGVYRTDFTPDVHHSFVSDFGPAAVTVAAILLVAGIVFTNKGLGQVFTALQERARAAKAPAATA